MLLVWLVLFVWLFVCLFGWFCLVGWLVGWLLWPLLHFSSLLALLQALESARGWLAEARAAHKDAEAMQSECLSFGGFGLALKEGVPFVGTTVFCGTCFLLTNRGLSSYLFEPQP